MEFLNKFHTHVIIYIINYTAKYKLLNNKSDTVYNKMTN